MRDKKEVREKFEELRANRLRKRKDEFLSRSCQNCVFNSKEHIKGRGKVRLCTNDKVLEKIGRSILVCEDDKVAQSCGAYQCRNTKEDVESSFDEILRSPARCGNEYPKLAIMIWFLQSQASGNRWERLRDAVRSMCRSAWHFAMFRWW